MEKHWIAVGDDGETIVAEQPTRQMLRDELYSLGLDPVDFDVVAVPAPHYSFFI